MYGRTQTATTERLWENVGLVVGAAAITAICAQISFGYPVPTHDEHEFTNRTACEIHKHSYSEQVVDAFKLVCSTR